MSIYEENIKPWELIRYIPRVISNVYYMFRARENSGKPFGIKFEVSAVCNLKCIMCPLSKGLKRPQGVLRFEKFKKVFNEVKPIYLNLTGIGEPLLNPDLFKIICYARAKGTIVKLDTNATLLDINNTIKLLAVKPNIVSVSIDGVNKKSYEKIRRGADFEVVIKNLKSLIEHRDKVKSKTKIHVNFVLQKSNIKELIDFIEYIDNLGVDAINGDIALSLGANKNVENRKINKEVIEKTKRELKKIKARASLNIEHIEDFINYDGEIKKQKKKHCFYPWYYPSITWDGNLVPCCYVCDNEIVFGNVIENSFLEIWNNEKIKTFRKMVADERKGICKECFIDETYIVDKLKLMLRIPFIKKISKRRWD